MVKAGRLASPRVVKRAIAKADAANKSLLNIAIGARHEAAWPSPTRTRLNSSYVDAQVDADPRTRATIAEKARHLTDNSPVIAGILYRISNLVVGDGLHPEPDSGDTVFDNEIDAMWQEFCPVADIAGLDDMGQLTRQIFEGKFVNGDGFTFLTQDELSEPKLQLIESHLVAGEDCYSLLDGITLDGLGREKSYRVCLSRTEKGDAVRNGDAEEIEAKYMVHHRWQRRAQEYRPLSALKAAVNTGHDLQDILAIEKAAVKDAGEITDVIETLTGEANTQGKVVSRIALQKSGTDLLNQIAQTHAYYERAFGPRAKYIKRGDKHTPYPQLRPSPAWIGMVDFLASCICLPTGFPPSVLLQIKVGGADTRRDLATAARIIGVMQKDLACELQKIRRYVLDMKLGSSVRPKNWLRADWNGPRSITCDAGRTQQQDREDLAMGVISLQEYCANQGTTMRRLFRQNAAARIERKRVADLNTLDPREIFNFELNAPAQVIPPAPTDPNQ